VFRVGAASVLLLLAFRSQAEVRSAPIDLTWEAPAECPQEASFLAAVTRLVGGTGRLTQGVVARVKVDRDADANFTLKLATELNGIAGERTLRGRSCPAVADAAVVTLALILNPDIELPADAGVEPRLFSAKPPQVETLRTTPQFTYSTLPSSPPRQPHRLSGLVASSVGIHFGVLPQPVPELSVGVGTAYGRFAAWAWGGYAPPTEVLVPGQPAQGGRLWAVAATALGCWAYADEAPRLGTCLGAEWTHVQGYGFGVPQSRNGAIDWVSPTIGLFSDFRLGPQGLFRLAVFGLAPLARPDTHLDNFGTVQRPAEIAAKLHAGVVVSFP
jgi:hypothetical protein